MKIKQTEIKKVELDPSFYKVHKVDTVKNDFGLDNSNELIDGALGLYSTVNMKKTKLGPLKTEFFRIALIRTGHVTVEIGLERFQPKRNSIVFGFPGQIFSLYNQSEDFFAYYLLFRKEFMDESLLLKNNREPFPFLSYTGVQSFTLNDDEATEIESLLMRINSEIKIRKTDITRAIQLYIQFVLFQANRSYDRQELAKQETAASANALFTRFIKLVSQHFLTLRKVTEYAELLHVTADHLNRTIKSQSKKTAHELIDEMILIEAKAYLLHTAFSVAEIAYQLGFSDPSHFNKFFKKFTSCTPLQFRSKPA